MYFRYIYFSVLIPLAASASLVVNEDLQYDYYEAEEDTRMCREGELDKSNVMNIVEALNTVRNVTQSGLLKNGWYGENLPKARNVTKLEWECELEEKAIAALKHECGGIGAKYVIPENLTGLYYRENQADATHLVQAVASWQNETQDVPRIKYIDEETRVVQYPIYDVENFLNLVRGAATKVGCAQTRCRYGSYRVFCLTDRPPLKLGDVVYEVEKNSTSEIKAR